MGGGGGVEWIKNAELRMAVKVKSSEDSMYLMMAYPTSDGWSMYLITISSLIMYIAVILTSEDKHLTEDEAEGFYWEIFSSSLLACYSALTFFLSV